MGNNQRTTQNVKIIDYMRKHGSITALEAMEELGVMRLASRINDIKKAGYSIKRVVVEGTNRDGGTVRYCKYSLDS